ncbi:MAG: Holliday junction branch migration protein RuvA [Spirochaetaceae bacterium]|jgi:Holliday junction DNA helicase RuvA|nr:Holliday junction branch migration protein RuvA [Spirochaetaceae bacterium]
MFNSIYGKICAKLPSAVYLLTGGIEWEVNMPSTDIGALPPIGDECRVWTWLCHREDAMLLYGFSGEERRATFHELLKVDGVGPKAAMKILGGISQTELERALESGDVARLEAVPGLGKKTAQKMILALKGKIVHGGEKSGRHDSPFNELADALSEMGYDKRTALSVLEKAAAEIGNSVEGAERENAIFRKAILFLSG